MAKPKILINRWMTKDGTILISRTSHQFVSHFDTVDQREVFIDGGIGPYIRVSGDLLNMCLYDTDEDHAQVRELYLWTSYGPTGFDPPKTQPIKALTTDHIENILESQIHFPEHVRNMFRRELLLRSA